ncbi:hypothetical protein [Butyrivibrio sp. AE3006]|uniref:hypothetical protein n=1 Tax=Butyrivibrio sp. AE3006 TaxID=1280673 RepID=UPI00047AF6E1|nr:hypothetical protein [Butyrivibrio sp. AE3006]
MGAFIIWLVVMVPVSALLTGLGMGSFITSQESYSISRLIKLDWIYNFLDNEISKSGLVE